MIEKLIIIGGVAGGATAAARARRLNEFVEIIVFERGEFISFANCGLPYYIGEVIRHRDNLLVATPELFKERYNIDVRLFSEVLSINKEEKSVTVKDLKTGKTYVEKYDKLILSPGAEPIRPKFEGIEIENIFNVRNIPDTDKIKLFVDKNKPESAVVVGGGFIGLEMAENLVHRGVKTTVVEMINQVMPPIDYEMATIIHAHLKEKGVSCILEDGVKSFSKNDNKIIVTTQKGQEINCDLVILSIGVKPESYLAKDAGLKLTDKGNIVVDSTMRTSNSDIYAVGDAVQVTDIVTGFPVMTALAGPANKQGRVASDNALGRKSVFKGTMGTSVAKVFDLTVASTGANEKTLRKYNIPYIISFTHTVSHASYYPGSEMMAFKLIFSPGSGKVLGAQIIGKIGVDKRIDVIATAIKANMTVYDLEELELAYAPPYSSAKDPVNVAGFVASNILKGDVENIYWDELGIIDGSDNILIDVRELTEIYEFGKIEKSIHIPLKDLRDKLSSLDKNKNYFIYCAIGLRGYIGYRILIQNGFKCKNISGGYNTYKFTVK